MKTTMPKLINDMPVATERGHGLGTKASDRLLRDWAANASTVYLILCLS